MKAPDHPPHSPHPPNTADEIRTHCIRCGTCCRKGGPALHREDARLVENGQILLKHLFTIREGEMAYDNVKNRLFPTPSDIIKIKNKRNRRSCLFLDEETSGCSIYANRPLECRTLQCWDPAAMESLYDRSRLTRKDLLAETGELLDLMSEHQERCDYRRIRDLIRDMESPNKGPVKEEIRFLIRYDDHLRALLSEKGNMDPELLDFLLGQPLSVTLKRIGISL